MTGQQHPSRERLGAGILILACMTTGFTAGVFADWSSTIMPGLRSVDDRTFVTAFQALDKAIFNPLFIGVEFTGSLVLTGLALLLHLRGDQRSARLLVGLALIGSLVTTAITFGVHEPLNQSVRTIDDLGSGSDFAAVRASLEEARWATWNTVRALASTLAFGSLVIALVVRGGIRDGGIRDDAMYDTTRRA